MKQQITRRAFFLMFCKAVLCTLLGLNFYRLQVLSSDKYKLLSDKNRIRVNILEAPRGLILDRNGVIIATNEFIYNLSVDSNQELQKILPEIGKICDKTNESKTSNTGRIIICEELNWEQVSKIESNIKINDFTKINQSYKRVYTYGKICSYLTGYTGLPSKNEQIEHSLKNDFVIGKNGLEMYFDESLQGRHGVQKVEVNAFNKVVNQISYEESTQGESLKTSIDVELQKKIAEINEDRRGIYIATTIDNGQVLAMYSTPGYEPNLFTGGIKSHDWNNIMSDPEKPMINRAIASLYPPGSTFKMITLLAILNSGISPNDSVYCSGTHQIGTRTFHCWKKYGHGYVNAYNALENSCNIYFAVQGMKCGIESISKIAGIFGLGKETGVELPFEAKGLIPTKKWKLNKYKKSWTPGDTVNISIGQGFALVTPIQLAMMTARIASGMLVEPTLLISDNKTYDEINLDHLDIIKSSMYNVMKNHHWEGLDIAGKTGTAQVISKRDAKGKYGDHSMFVGFGPYHSPKYAVVSIVENAGWGADTALPITKEIFRNLYEMIGR